LLSCEPHSRHATSAGYDFRSLRSFVGRRQFLMPSLTRPIVVGFVALGLSLGLQSLAVAQDPAEAPAQEAPSETSEVQDTSIPAAVPETTSAPDESQSEAAPVEAPVEEYSSSSDEEPQAPPKVNRSMLYTGIGVILAGYAIAGASGEALNADDGGEKACSYCDKGRLMWIPLAGPWMVLPSADDANGRAVAVATGLMQAGGLALLIAGIVDVVSSRGKQKESNVAIRVGATPSLALAKLHLKF
jgi:hypothetical protein